MRIHLFTSLVDWLNQEFIYNILLKANHGPGSRAGTEATEAKSTVAAISQGAQVGEKDCRTISSISAVREVCTSVTEKISSMFSELTLNIKKTVSLKNLRLKTYLWNKFYNFTICLSIRKCVKKLYSISSQKLGWTNRYLLVWLPTNVRGSWSQHTRDGKPPRAILGRGVGVRTTDIYNLSACFSFCEWYWLPVSQKDNREPRLSHCESIFKVLHKCQVLGYNYFLLLHVAHNVSDVYYNCCLDTYQFSFSCKPEALCKPGIWSLLVNSERIQDVKSTHWLHSRGISRLENKLEVGNLNNYALCFTVVKLPFILHR